MKKYLKNIEKGFENEFEKVFEDDFEKEFEESFGGRYEKEGQELKKMWKIIWSRN